jgi:hypothetical protein
VTDGRNFNGSLGRRTAVGDSVAGEVEGLYGVCTVTDAFFGGEGVCDSICPC